MSFTEEALAVRLRGGLGDPLRFFASIDSTNTEALAWAQQGAPHGALVVTDHQTGGRGRWGRSWFSMPGKLLQLSLVVRPDLPFERAGRLSVAAGLAVARGIEAATGLGVRVKWPNDVTLAGRKLSGILIETVAGAEGIDAAVIGAGINVDVARDEFPEEMRATATSLAAELGAPVDRVALLGHLMDAFDQVLGMLHEPALIDAAAARSTVIGHVVTARLSDGSTIEGAAVGLAEDGGLRLSTPRGETVLHVAEVTRIRAR